MYYMCSVWGGVTYHVTGFTYLGLTLMLSNKETLSSQNSHTKVNRCLCLITSTSYSPSFTVLPSSIQSGLGEGGLAAATVREKPRGKSDDVLLQPDWEERRKGSEKVRRVRRMGARQTERGGGKRAREILPQVGRPRIERYHSTVNLGFSPTAKLI